MPTAAGRYPGRGTRSRASTHPVRLRAAPAWRPTCTHCSTRPRRLSAPTRTSRIPRRASASACSDESPRPPPPSPPKQGAAIPPPLSDPRIATLYLYTPVLIVCSALDVPFCTPHHIRPLSPHHVRVYSALSLAAPSPCRAGPPVHRQRNMDFFSFRLAAFKKGFGGERGERERHSILFNGGISISLLIPFSAFLIFGMFLHSEGIFLGILFIRERRAFLFLSLLHAGVRLPRCLVF